MMTEVTLYHGDCLEILPTLEAGSVDAVITDPPYGIGFQSNASRRYEKLTNDTEDFDLSLYIPYIENAVKDNGAAYYYCRWDIAYKWQGFIRPHAQIVFPKGRTSMGDLDNYANEYDVVLFRMYGNHKIDATELQIPNNSHAKNPPPYKRRIGDLSPMKSVEAWERAQHPTQKTVLSARVLIQVSTNPGDTILDPFMGSGTTGVACVQTGRNFIGIEIDRNYYEIAEKRIAQAQLQIRMPI